MAHVIASSPAGPRGVADGGSDEYENLILLCPTCHRAVDKAPSGVFPVELLRQWKRDHEAQVRASGAALRFSSLAELKSYISRLLTENKAIWASVGPRSLAAQADPGSNMHSVWTLRKLDTILPNNRKIINAVDSNMTLLGAAETEAFFAFKLHAQAFEEHQYQRLDSYPQFPGQFEVVMRP